MKVDTSLLGGLATAGADAAAAEAAGYDGIWTLEGQHDPFLPLVLAAEHTERVQLGTAIAVAFARNPMLLANIGWDLQGFSGGRLILGLGSQIKPHITKRFSMPWSQPAARMRDLVLATRAIWDAWLTGGRLAYRGDFYTHTLMTPFFTPDASELDGSGPPLVFLAGVGELMIEVAGEVADGFLCHPLTTERYLREVIVPALERGRAKAGRTMDGFEIVGPNFVVTGADEQAMAAAAEGTRRQIAFYASTPAYWPVLELHGWGDLGRELNRLSKRGAWVAMGDRIDDEVLGTVAVVAEPDQVAPRLQARFGDVVHRINLYDSYRTDPVLRLALLEALAGR